MKLRGLTLNIGLGCLGCDGAAAAVVVAGAGVGAVTWSAGSASGTVCSVGRIVVDILPQHQFELNTSLGSPLRSHPPLPPRTHRARRAPALTRTPPT